MATRKQPPKTKKITIVPNPTEGQASPLSKVYPNYYKPTAGLSEVDVYAVHALFGIEDPSGMLQHSSKKLLLSGVRTGNKLKQQDIVEARDTLNRWIELNALGLVE